MHSLDLFTTLPPSLDTHSQLVKTGGRAHIADPHDPLNNPSYVDAT